MEPAPPTVTVVTDDDGAAIAVAIGNADPLVTHNEVYRRNCADVAGIRVAAAATADSVWVDHTPVSRIPYAYRVAAVTAAGDRSWSAWTVTPTPSASAYPSLVTFPGLTQYPYSPPAPPVVTPYPSSTTYPDLVSYPGE